jgi:glycosidase
MAFESYKNSTVYQIYPRSFCDSDGDGVGDIRGIISKLDYLEELGVTTIYLNPIGMANSNHKYDTSDYMRVDPMFGTEKDFKDLIDRAKEKNIQIIFDGVYNHTGSDSVYFNRYGRFDTLGAYKSKESKFYSWYNFIDYPDEYISWWGFDTLPSIRDDCEEFQEYIAGENGVLDKFMKLGVAGVRLDVVDEITDRFVKKIEDRVHKYG